MSYNKKNKTFNLTVTKMRYWHRHTNHQNEKDCIYCQEDMIVVAKYLEGLGFEILGSGENWLKIKAEKNYRDVAGGRTDETNYLYELISGQKNN